MKLSGMVLPQSSATALHMQLLCLLADGQKAAKQAIYSLHRGDFDRATQQLHAAGVSSPAADGGQRHKPLTHVWVRLMLAEHVRTHS